MIKKIAIGIMIPLIVSILGWATWVTRKAFSAQQTEVMLQEHKISANKNRDIIQKELDSINDIVQKGFDNLNEKIDKNTKDNNGILLDLQKQIGQLNRNKGD